MKKNNTLFFITSIFGLIIALLSIYSEELNLGISDNFIIYKYFGLRRFYFFSFGIFLIIFGLFYIMNIKKFIIDKFKLNINKFMRVLQILIFILIFLLVFENILNLNNFKIYINFKNSLIFNRFELIILCIIFVLLIRKFLITKNFSNKVDQNEEIFLSKQSYFYIIIIILLDRFILSGHHNAFEWSTTQDLPILLNLIEPNFLPNDFYTNSVIESPRVFFSYPIYFLNIFLDDWYASLYFYKVILISTSKALMFLMMCAFYEINTYNDVSKINLHISRFVIFLISIDTFSFLQVANLSSGPFGWGAIQMLNHLTPMTMSFLFGLIYNYFSVININKKYNFAILFLIISTLVHPVVGLMHFFLNFIFLFYIYFKSLKLKNIAKDCFIGFIIPTICLIVFFKSSNPIDAETYINQYIHLRHAHHYRMSTAINLSAMYKWIFLHSILIILSFLTKNKKIVIISFFSFGLFIFGPLVQYLGTEIFQIKSIAKLGPSRFSAFTSLVWFLNFVIVISIFLNKKNYFNFFAKKVFILFKKFSTAFYIKENIIIFNNLISKKIFIILILICIFLTFKLTLKYPFEKDIKVQSIINWIKQNTKDNAIFFSPNFNNFVLRIYAQRATFVDSAYPFNESASTEWANRYVIFRKYEKLSYEHYKCINTLYNVDYLIFDKKKYQLKNLKPVYNKDNYLIYFLGNQVTSTENCNVDYLKNAK